METLRQIASMCDEIGPDDGIDPRLLRRESKGNNNGRESKHSQLRKQVENIIRLTLDELGDEAFEGLSILGVETGSNAGHLIVLVGPAHADAPPEEADVMAAMARVHGVLRGAVASSIHRKRVPTLSFRFVPGAGGDQ